MSNVNLNVESECGNDVTFNVSFKTIPSSGNITVAADPQKTIRQLLEAEGRSVDDYTARADGRKLDVNQPVPAGTGVIFLTQTKKLEGQA